MARHEEGDVASDPTRREFFRMFGREAVRNAGAVMGAAAEFRRASGVAANDLLDVRHTAVSERSTPDALFSSAYRLADDGLLILDQRELPGRMDILTCREPTEVATAIRLGAINGGPILGEVAAYAVAMAVRGTGDNEVAGRERVLNTAANTLRTAR